MWMKVCNVYVAIFNLFWQFYFLAGDSSYSLIACLFVCRLCVCLFVYLSVHFYCFFFVCPFSLLVCVCLSVHLFVCFCLSICLYVYLSVHLFVCPFITCCLFICLYDCLSIFITCLFDHLFVCLCVHFYCVCLFVCPFLLFVV